MNHISKFIQNKKKFLSSPSSECLEKKQHFSTVSSLLNNETKTNQQETGEHRLIIDDLDIPKI